MICLRIFIASSYYEYNWKRFISFFKYCYEYFTLDILYIFPYSNIILIYGLIYLWYLYMKKYLNLLFLIVLGIDLIHKRYSESSIIVNICFYVMF